MPSRWVIVGSVLIVVVVVGGFAIGEVRVESRAPITAPSVGLSGDAQEIPRYDHIVVIIEENREHTRVLGNPDAPNLNRLAREHGLATRFFAVIHPSQGNYVALVGGDSYGIADDLPFDQHQIANASLVDQLEGSGLTWKAYFQSLPYAGYRGTCYPDEQNCLYASKHNGFVTYARISMNPVRMEKLVPIEELALDLRAGTLANLTFVIPDQCHDMHGLPGSCPDDAANVREGDRYLADLVGQITSADFWTGGRNAIVVTFDEGDTTAGCCGTEPGGGQIVTVVITNRGATGREDATLYNHYSLVATIERAFGLDCLQRACGPGIRVMASLFAD